MIHPVSSCLLVIAGAARRCVGGVAWATGPNEVQRYQPVDTSATALTSSCRFHSVQASAFGGKLGSVQEQPRRRDETKMMSSTGVRTPTRRRPCRRQQAQMLPAPAAAASCHPVTRKVLMLLVCVVMVLAPSSAHSRVSSDKHVPQPQSVCCHDANASGSLKHELHEDASIADLPLCKHNVLLSLRRTDLLTDMVQLQA